MFVWFTLIYNPIAYWTWNTSGWVFKIGSLDFASGTPVYIFSGCATLAYSIILGKRRGHCTYELNYRPHNVIHIVIGALFLWVGWFGFNAGFALAANIRAIMATCVGGITWYILDYRFERKWSAVGFCSGIIAGLGKLLPKNPQIPEE
jgi:Amt family ammonium transporter